MPRTNSKTLNHSPEHGLTLFYCFESLRITGSLSCCTVNIMVWLHTRSETANPLCRVKSDDYLEHSSDSSVAKHFLFEVNQCSIHRERDETWPQTTKNIKQSQTTLWQLQRFTFCFKHHDEKIK